MIRDGKTIKDGLKFIYQDNYLKSYDELSEWNSGTVKDRNLERMGKLLG